jgi:hypothetical protein
MMLLKYRSLTKVPVRPSWRLFSKSSIFQDEPTIIDIDQGRQANAYRGSLLIVPTPLGNLGDMSLRQYEALTVGCDVIACEDTRKTGKMLQMMRDRRLRNKFFNEFGVDVETWMSGADEEGESFGTKVNRAKREGGAAEEADDFEELKQDLSSETPEPSQGEDGGDTFFHMSEEEFNDQRLLNRLTETNTALDEAMQEPTEEVDSLRARV